MKLTLTVAAASGLLNIGLVTAAANGSTARANVGLGQGIGSSYIVWNCQVQSGANATSAIATTGSVGFCSQDQLQLHVPAGLILTLRFAHGSPSVIEVVDAPFQVAPTVGKGAIQSIYASGA